MHRRAVFSVKPLCHPLTSKSFGSISALAMESKPPLFVVLIGTSGGYLLQYNMDKTTSDSRSSTLVLKLERLILRNGSISRICVLSSLTCVAVVAAGKLLFLHLHTLKVLPCVLPAIGALRCICPISSNRNRPSDHGRQLLLLATSRKLLLLALTVSDDSENGDQTAQSMSSAAVNAINVKEWTDIPHVESMVCIKSSALVATRSSYLILSLTDGPSTPLTLFSLSKGSPHHPLVMAFPASCEALLLAEKAGIVVNDKGHPSGGTLVFHSVPVSVGLCSPYLVSCDSKGRLEVFHRQHNNGASVQRVDGLFDEPLIFADGQPGFGLLAASHSQIWHLECVPLLVQVRECLKAGRHDEALLLAGELQPGETESERCERTSMAHAQSGLLLLGELRFKEAFESIAQSQDLQPIELLRLVPDLCRKWKSTIPRKRYWGLHPPLQSLHDMIKAGLKSVSSGVLEVSFSPTEPHHSQLLTEAMDYLCKYLLENRNREMAESDREAIDTVLILLCAQLNLKEEADNLIRADCRCLTSEVEGFLADRGWHSTMAVLLEKQGMKDRAIAVWADLARGDTVESSPDGQQDFARRAMDEVARLLVALGDGPTSLKHAIWMLDVDADAALSVLTSPSVPPDDALSVLPAGRQDVRLRYLEWLIDIQNSASTRHRLLYGTALSNTLLSLRRRHSTESAVALEEKLQAFLRSCDRELAQQILAHISGSELWAEQVLLHGLLGAHEPALKILVHELGDYRAAESYCTHVGTPQVFALLLSIYLNPSEGCPPLHLAAVRLLYCPNAQLDPMHILQAISPELKLSQVYESIAQVLLERTHTRNTKQIVCQMSRASCFNSKEARALIQHQKILISEDTTCSSCDTRIGTKLFGRLPNGVLACYQCMQEFGELGNEKIL